MRDVQLRALKECAFGHHMVCGVCFQKAEEFSYGLGSPLPWGTCSGFIQAHYSYKTSEISLRGEQLGMEKVNVVCLPFVLETEDPIPHFQTP
jgi:hypothetical protein